MPFSTEVSYTQNLNTPEWLIDISVRDGGRVIVIIGFMADQKIGAMFWQDGVSFREQIAFMRDHEAEIRDLARAHAMRAGAKW